MHGIVKVKIGLALVFLSTGAMSQEVIPLTTVSGYSPTALWVGSFLTSFIPEADRQLATTGNYEIDWNTPFGSIAKPGGALETVQYGLADIGIVVTSFHSDKIPFYNLSYVTPFVTTDIRLVVRTVSDLHDDYPVLKEQWSDFRQVYLITAGLVGTYQAVLNRPITQIDDFRGLKMSGVGINQRYFEGLGAVAVSSGLADWYNNISSGLSDGAIAWPEAIVSFKLYEVGSYLVDARLGAVSSVALTANQRTWERLPAEVQGALLRAAEVYRDELAQETIRRGARAMDVFEAEGGTVISLSEEQRRAWAASVPDLANEWVDDIENRGLPGRELLNDYMETMRENGQPVMRGWDRE